MRSKMIKPGLLFKLSVKGIAKEFVFVVITMRVNALNALSVNKRSTIVQEFKSTDHKFTAFNV